MTKLFSDKMSSEYWKSVTGQSSYNIYNLPDKYFTETADQLGYIIEEIYECQLWTFNFLLSMTVHIHKMLCHVLILLVMSYHCFLSYIATSTIEVPLYYLVQRKTIMLIIIFKIRQPFVFKVNHILK